MKAALFEIFRSIRNRFTLARTLAYGAALPAAGGKELQPQTWGQG